MVNRLSSVIHKKTFADYFKNNVYLSQLKTLEKAPNNIGKNTTHCAPFLQKLLTGEGQKNDTSYNPMENMLSHLSSVMIDLIEKEHKYFDSITTHTDDYCRGYTDVGPGTVIHQSVCLGSH